MDGGASENFVAKKDYHCVSNISPISPPLSVMLPNGSQTVARHRGRLTSSHLPDRARDCFLLPDFPDSLLSVGRLCDAGHRVHYDAASVTVHGPHGPVMSGPRAPSGLWTIDMAPSSTHSPQPTHPNLTPARAFNAAPLPTVAARVAWAVGAMGNPTQATMLAALKKDFIHFSGLSPETLQRYPPLSLATAQGHLTRHRQGLRSTKPASPLPAKGSTTPPIRTHTDRYYLDSTGKLPTVSARGADTILILVHSDTGYIKLEPVHGRTAPSITKAFRAAYNWLKDHDLTASQIRLDNEISNEFMAAVKATGLKTELCPPGNHRANAAERYVRTVKDHFIAILAAVDPDFPADAWDLLLPHAELTLNLLRESRRDSTISAWHQACGPYDFEAHPIDPPGTTVLVYEGREERRSWDPHGLKAYYLGPSLSHYRCYNVLVEGSRGIRVSDSLSWHPSRLLLPRPTLFDTINDSVECLTLALQELSTHRDEGSDNLVIPPELAADLTLQLRRLRSACIPASPPSSTHSVADAFRDTPRAITPPNVSSTPPAQDRGGNQHPPPRRPRHKTGVVADVSSTPPPALHDDPAPTTERSSKPSLPTTDPVTSSQIPFLAPAPSTPPDSDNPCRICRVDDGIGLLCDACDACWHPACVGLRRLPRGTWLCPRCRRGPTPPRGDRTDKNPCQACGLGDHKGLLCDVCDQSWHLHCLGLPSVPAGTWTCPRCHPPPHDQRGRLHPSPTGASHHPIPRRPPRVQGVKPASPPTRAAQGVVKPGASSARLARLKTTTATSPADAPTTALQGVSSRILSSDRVTPGPAPSISDWLDRRSLNRDSDLDSDLLSAIVTEWLSEPVTFSLALSATPTPTRLTFRKATSGPRAAAFREAHEKEHAALFNPQSDGEACLTFVSWSELPPDVKPCPYVLVVREKPLPDGTTKAKVRGVADGSHLPIDEPVMADTADIDVIKVHWNATVSSDRKRAIIDAVNFYVGSEMTKHYYMVVRSSQLPESVRNSPTVIALMRGDRILVRIQKGLYGLPQAGRLARDRLVNHLGKADYVESEHVPSLFRHRHRDISFVLTVDDFDVSYRLDSDFEHLIGHIRQLYRITVDLEGKRYVGIDTLYDKSARKMVLSMDRYYEKALSALGVEKGTREPAAPMPYTAPAYGRHGPQRTASDTSPAASPAEKRFLQRCLGTWLYPARWIDPTLLPALSRLAAQQCSPTKRTMHHLQILLQWIAWHPTPRQTIRASDMRLFGAADASYLSEPASRSRAGEVLWLGDADGTVSAPLACSSSIIPIVVCSATEAEYASLFLTGGHVTWIRTILQEMGFPQPSSPGTVLLTDNDCARGLACRTTKQRRSKTIDMRFHKVRNQVEQGILQVIRCPGPDNPADYLTKAHPAHHHKDICHIFYDGTSRMVGTKLSLNSA